jgi:hypothetical protein
LAAERCLGSLVPIAWHGDGFDVRSPNGVNKSWLVYQLSRIDYVFRFLTCNLLECLISFGSTDEVAAQPYALYSRN